MQLSIKLGRLDMLTEIRFIHNNASSTSPKFSSDINHIGCYFLFQLTSTVSSIPLAGGVVAGLVTVAIFDPASWAALLTVWHRPRQVHLSAERS